MRYVQEGRDNCDSIIIMRDFNDDVRKVNREGLGLREVLLDGLGGKVLPEYKTRVHP